MILLGAVLQFYVGADGHDVELACGSGFSLNSELHGSRLFDELIHMGIHTPTYTKLLPAITFHSSFCRNGHGYRRKNITDCGFITV